MSLTDADLAMLARVAGLDIPPGFHAEVFAGARALKAAANRMRGANAEPAHVFAAPAMLPRSGGDVARPARDPLASPGGPIR